MKKFLLTLGVLVLGLALLVGCSPTKAKKEGDDALDKTQKKTAETVDARSLREAAKDDPFKDCNSCHKKEADKDVSLQAEVKKIEGHPPVGEDATIKTCMAANCHGSGDLKTKLSNTLHNKHASSDIFRPKLKGNCVSCHALDDSGQITLKGAS